MITTSPIYGLPSTLDKDGAIVYYPAPRYVGQRCGGWLRPSFNFRFCLMVRNSDF